MLKTGALANRGSELRLKCHYRSTEGKNIPHFLWRQYFQPHIRICRISPFSVSLPRMWLPLKSSVLVNPCLPSLANTTLAEESDRHTGRRYTSASATWSPPNCFPALQQTVSRTIMRVRTWTPSPSPGKLSSRSSPGPQPQKSCRRPLKIIRCASSANFLTRSNKTFSSLPV